MRRGRFSGTGVSPSRAAARRRVELRVTTGMRSVFTALEAAPTSRWGRASRSSRSSRPETGPTSGGWAAARACSDRWTSGTGASSSAVPSAISNATTVTLSGAPPLRVKSTRVSTAWLRASESRSTSWIFSGETTSVRPSEQNSQRSPGATGTSNTSSSGEASTSPSTRMSTFLFGWNGASPASRRPSSTSFCTNVWSVVTWENSPSASR